MLTLIMTTPQARLPSPRLVHVDTQLLFNIEALKIAKRARDQREGDRGKASKGKTFLQQLRKFRSLPNLSAIRNLKMIRNLSRNRLDRVEEDRWEGGEVQT